MKYQWLWYKGRFHFKNLEWNETFRKDLKLVKLSRKIWSLELTTSLSPEPCFNEFQSFRQHTYTFTILPTTTLETLLKPKTFRSDSTRSSEGLYEDEEWEDGKVVWATVVMSMAVSFNSCKTTFPWRCSVKWLQSLFLHFSLDYFLQIILRM